MFRTGRPRQRRVELDPVDDRRTELADGNARGDVGDHRSLFNRTPLDQRHRKGGQRRITGTGHVCDLEHRRLEVPNRLPWPDQGHAGFCPRDQDRAIELPRDARAGSLDLRVRRTGHAACGRQFSRVRLDEISAAIGFEGATLGIDKNLLSQRSGRANNLPEHPVTEHAFGIVGDHHDAGVSHRGEGRCDKPLLHFLRQARGNLAVDPEELLAAADDAGLADGRSRPIRHEMRGGYARSGQDVIQILCVLIVPDDPDQPHVASQSQTIDRDVGCAAGHRPVVAVQQHRNGRFGRNAFDLSGHVAVEHDIANDHDRIRPAFVRWHSVSLCRFSELGTRLGKIG